MSPFFSITACVPILISSVFSVRSTGVLPVSTRATPVFHVGQLHVDVLRGSTPAHGSGRGIRQRRVRDALVLRHRLGGAGRAHHPVRLVEELFRRHRPVSPSGRRFKFLRKGGGRGGDGIAYD